MDEDRLLATLMHNMTAFMVMTGAPVKAIQQKIRRLLGKSHVGLVHSQHINVMLDTLNEQVYAILYTCYSTLCAQTGNSVMLKPIGSRLMQRHTFTVYAGSDSKGSMMFMEVPHWIHTCAHMP